MPGRKGKGRGTTRVWLIWFVWLVWFSKEYLFFKIGRIKSKQIKKLFFSKASLMNSTFQ